MSRLALSFFTVGGLEGVQQGITDFTLALQSGASSPGRLARSGSQGLAASRRQ